MSSDDPIEPIHGIEPIETRPARGLREKSYRVFTRLLENALLWKRFQNSNEMNKDKQRKGKPKQDEPEEPKNTSEFDAKA